MCCLAYEYAFYEKAKKHIPKVGKRVTVPEGEGKVVRQNVLKEVMTIFLDSGQEMEISFNDYLSGQHVSAGKSNKEKKRSNHKEH